MSVTETATDAAAAVLRSSTTPYEKSGAAAVRALWAVRARLLSTINHLGTCVCAMGTYRWSCPAWSGGTSCWRRGDEKRREERANVRFCSVPVRDLVRCTWSMRVFWRFQKIKNQKRSNAPPRPGMPMRGATRGRNPRRHRHVPNRGAGPGSGLVGFRRSASARYRTICNNYDDVRRYLHE